MRRKVFVTLFLAVILCFTGFGIFWSQQRMGELSVFNWEKDVVTVENPDVFFDEFSKSNICAVYQWIPSKISGRDMSSYLESACTHGIDVYLLTGDPSWALEEDGETMSSEILRVQEINEMAPKDAQMKGIVMDVEPYLTDDWDNAPKQVMERFALGLENTYQKAQSCGLEFIVCIPYFYDTEGYKDQLETILAKGCDSAAVMNYYKGKEEEHIADETALARKYGKKLINIYELQPPKGSSIVEANTYYHEGLGAVMKNAARLNSVYKGDIRFAIHDYNAWKELKENE